MFDINDKELFIICQTTFYMYRGPETPPYYFLNNSVKSEPILIDLTLYEITRKFHTRRLQICPSHL